MIYLNTNLLILFYYRVLSGLGLLTFSFPYQCEKMTEKATNELQQMTVWSLTNSISALAT